MDLPAQPWLHVMWWSTDHYTDILDHDRSTHDWMIYRWMCFVAAGFHAPAASPYVHIYQFDVHSQVNWWISAKFMCTDHEIWLSFIENKNSMKRCIFKDMCSMCASSECLWHFLCFAFIAYTNLRLMKVMRMLMAVKSIWGILGLCKGCVDGVNSKYLAVQEVERVLLRLHCYCNWS